MSQYQKVAMIRQVAMENSKMLLLNLIFKVRLSHKISSKNKILFLNLEFKILRLRWKMSLMIVNYLNKVAKKQKK